MNNPRRIQRHLVKALAAGSVLVAAALPLAISGVASAATAPTLTSVTFAPGGTNDFGQGASGNVTIAGGGFAVDGGNVTVTSTAPGLTFSGVTESAAGVAAGTFASTSATVPGTYSVTYVDDNGTVTDTGLITVNADPSFTSVSPTGLVDLAAPTTSGTPVTVTGTGFVTGAKVTFTNATNGTTLSSVATVDTFTTTGTSTVATTPAQQGTAAFGSSTSLTVAVDPTNSVSGAPATIGTYTVTVTNPDGGSVVSGSVFTISGNEISEVTPSAVPVVTATASSTPITVTGSGFSSSATLALSGTGCNAGVTLGTATPGANSISDTLLVNVAAATAAATTPELCTLTVTNTSPGNGATFSSVGAIGIGEASTVAPTITASSLSAAAAVLPGAPAQTITFTGTGFSQFTAPVGTLNAAGTADTHALIGTTAGSCLGGQTGTTLTCELVVNTGAASGAHSAVVENTAATSAFPAAFSVAGPTITSAAPVALAVGAPVGTIVALTGTGFGPTTTGSIVASVGTAPTGVFQNVSATQEDFVVTATVGSTSTDAITVSSFDSYGASSTSAPFAFAVQGAPAVSSTTYVTGTTGVGVGAKAQIITVNGSGFATGATIGKFVSTAAVADPAVTGTVTSVNAAGTQLTATIAIAAGDLNRIDGFTITNTNGGTTTATAAAPAGLVIDAGPTVTAVAPATAVANSTNAFTITGTGFLTGATVSATGSGTCGVATVVSATSITVSCTIGAKSATAVTLVVTNLDGGAAASATVLAASTTTTASGFSIGAVHGSAVVGRTVTLTISGTGFYGQPKITSSAPGTRAVVTKDSGKLLTVRVTTAKTTKAGEKTFTIKLANGKSGKRNYKLVK